MSSISAQDLQRLAGLQGYDLTLEIDALSRKYGMSPDEIVAVQEDINAEIAKLYSLRKDEYETIFI